MKVYKVEVMIIDFDRLGPDDIKSAIENTRYANHCISPQVKSIAERDIGEWDDNHPLNRRDTCDAEYRRLFGIETDCDELDCSRFDISRRKCTVARDPFTCNIRENFRSLWGGNGTDPLNNQVK